ncbi:MAG: SRPBCC family protein [Acidimicrobiales bacterium]
MIELTDQTQVPQTATEVWALLSDFGAISGWADNVDHSCLLSDQTSGLGTVRRIQSGRNVVVETVTIWQPETSLAYRITGLPPVIKLLSNAWTLESNSQGTLVTLATRMDAGPRPPQKVIAKAVGRKMAKAAEQMLSGLAAALTAPSASENSHE